MVSPSRTSRASASEWSAARWTATVTCPRTDSAGIVRGAAEAGEDLAAHRQIPVAKAGADHPAAGRPGAAAQHLVLGAEELLRVLRIGEGAKALVGREVGRRPLPDVAEHLHRAAVRSAVGVGPGGSGAEGEPVEVGPLAAGAGCGRLPLALGRQPLPRPAGEGVGLLPG